MRRGAIAAQGLERGGDLGGVVAIIVDQGRALYSPTWVIRRSTPLKRPGPRRPFRGRRRRHDRRPAPGSRCTDYVSRERQAEASRRACPCNGRCRSGSRSSAAIVDRHPIAAFGRAAIAQSWRSERPRSRHRGRQPLRLPWRRSRSWPLARIRPFRRHMSAKRAERGDDVVEIFIAIEVVGLDIGDHADGRVEVVKAAVILARLDHERSPAARVARPAELRHGAADDERRIGVAAQQGMRYQRGGRGFAVRAGDGDREALLHDLPEELGVFDGWEAELLRRQELGIGVRHGGGAHDQIDLAAQQFPELGPADLRAPLGQSKAVHLATGRSR